MSRKPLGLLFAVLSLSVGLPAVCGNAAREPQFFLQRGQALAKAGKWAAALHEYDLALAMQPHCGDAYAARAQVHLEQKSPALAAADVTEALRADCRCAEAYVVRAAMQQSRGNLPDAVRS